MKIAFPHNWLITQPRDKLEKYLKSEINKVSMTQIDVNSVLKDDTQITHQASLNNAIMTVCHLLLHILIDPKEYPRPWLMRDRIKGPLEVVEFKEYISKVRGWLAKQAPTNFYGSLVYMQALTFLLSTMEITTNAE